MKSCKLTDFGLCVKTELLRLGKEQKWLAGMISERTGLYVDSSYLAKIFTGQRNAPRVVAAIREILNLPEEGGMDGERKKNAPRATGIAGGAGENYAGG